MNNLQWLMDQIKQKPQEFTRLRRFSGEITEFIKLAKELGYYEYSDCYTCATPLKKEEQTIRPVLKGNSTELEAFCYKHIPCPHYR